MTSLLNCPSNLLTTSTQISQVTQTQSNSKVSLLSLPISPLPSLTLISQTICFHSSLYSHSSYLSLNSFMDTPMNPAISKILSLILHFLGLQYSSMPKQCNRISACSSVNMYPNIYTQHIFVVSGTNQRVHKSL